VENFIVINNVRIVSWYLIRVVTARRQAESAVFWHGLPEYVGRRRRQLMAVSAPAPRHSSHQTLTRIV